jgi:ADP-heptose:LPS heptosyltransferase
MNRQDDIAVLVQNRPFFGAVLVHVPLLYALRRSHPSSRIVLYSTFERARLLCDLGLADDFVLYRRASWSLWRSLRRHRHGTIISLRRESEGLAFLVAATGAKRTLSFKRNLNRFLYRRTIRRRLDCYRAAGLLRLTKLLNVEFDISEVHAFFQELASASSWQPPDRGPVLCVIPCCSDDRKQWGLPSFLRYCRLWREAEPTASFVFVLGPRERRYVAEIEGSDLATSVTCLVEADVPTVARAVFASKVTVINDCAPGHIAQMTGRPVVCVLGNWDGNAASRLKEWLYERPGAIGVTSPDRGPICEIAVDAVFDASRKAALSLPPVTLREPGVRDAATAAPARLLTKP